MPLIEVEAGEESSLVLSSVKGFLEQNWSTKLLRKYEEEEDADSSILESLVENLSEMGIFEFVRIGSAKDVALLGELLGSKLLPGIVVSTLASLRSVKNSHEIFAEGRKKQPLVAFSFSNIVPDVRRADFVLIWNTLYKRDEISLSPIRSLDGTMRFFMATPKTAGQKVDVNLRDALLVVISHIVGSGEECVSAATNYAKYRTAFGKPIGSFQAIKHKLVDGAISVELCRSQYLGKIEENGPSEEELKYSARKVSRVITDAIQVHGGVGFTRDVDLHLHLRRVIALEKIYSRNS